ncbi:hypothetical protein MP228_011423 [Amoeboaphelidium protococcarum]|nr:hypothetical protein MP228_011423 [Amoeboaphelidium protococcarum]
MTQGQIQFHDGNTIPVIGLGVWKASQGEAYKAVLHALKVGYRHIDTAAAYENEEDVGRAIADSKIPREEIFVTTKLATSGQKDIDSARTAFKTSLKKLGLDYVDLYLIHSPQVGPRLESWKALVQLKKEGLIKSIGVSNYNIHHLKEIEKAGLELPVINQIEMHPYLYKTRKELVDFCNEKKIVIEAYSPLTHGKKIKDEKSTKMANKYGKSNGQMLIKWCIEMNFVVIPKSVNESRIEENFNVMDFKLKPEDLDEMNSWDENLVTCWNPLEWE